jgi:exodeoxyribonuclease VII small subunit
MGQTASAGGRLQRSRLQRSRPPASRLQRADSSGADPTSADLTTPDAELGYEQARDELIDVVRQLEAGGATLEESLALWERGERLAAICHQRLDGARARLQAVSPPGTDAESGAGPGR